MGSAFKGTKAEVVSEVSPISQNSRAHKKRTAKEETSNTMSKQGEIICGDSLEVLRGFSDESVDCCITSPPYFGLRDYCVDGQIGLEETPKAYVQKLMEVFREVKRVLKKEGTLWLNLGDSYSSGGKMGGDIDLDTGIDVQRGRGRMKEHPEIKHKDLVGIPWMVAFALRKDGWYLRQDIIWAKPNPMPESVTDRCTKAHEYIFLLSKSPKYYFDNEAVWEPAAESSVKRIEYGLHQNHPADVGIGVPPQNTEKMGKRWLRFKEERITNENRPDAIIRDREFGYDSKQKIIRAMWKEPSVSEGSIHVHKRGNKMDKVKDDPLFATKPQRNMVTGAWRNRRSVWTVTTKPFKEAHFATFPEALIEPMVLAGCPKEICKKCGKVMEQIRERQTPSDWEFRKTKGAVGGSKYTGNKQQIGSGWSHDLASADFKVVGMTDCGCSAGFQGGIVLDPFFGAGTTGVVAKKLGRNYIGIELNKEYCQIAQTRIDGTGNPLL